MSHTEITSITSDSESSESPETYVKHLSLRCIIDTERDQGSCHIMADNREDREGFLSLDVSYRKYATATSESGDASPAETNVYYLLSVDGQEESPNYGYHNVGYTTECAIYNYTTNTIIHDVCFKDKYDMLFNPSVSSWLENFFQHVKTNDDDKCCCQE